MKKIIRFAIALGVLSVVAAGKLSASPRTILIVPPAQAAAVVSMENLKSNETKIQQQKTVSFEIPLLKRVCSCESWGDPNKEPREFGADGKVLRGFPDPSDIGACQIHTPVWGAQAKLLGYDIYTLKGNVEMANYIYKVQGLSAWNASKASCWDKS